MITTKITGIYRISKDKNINYVIHVKTGSRRSLYNLSQE